MYTHWKSTRVSIAKFTVQYSLVAVVWPGEHYSIALRTGSVDPDGPYLASVEVQHGRQEANGAKINGPLVR